MEALEKLKTHIETANHPSSLAILSDPDITKQIAKSKWQIDATITLPNTNAVVLRANNSAFTTPKTMQTAVIKLKKLAKSKSLNYQVEGVGIFYGDVYSLRIIVSDTYADMVKAREKLFELLVKRYV